MHLFLLDGQEEKGERRTDALGDMNAEGRYKPPTCLSNTYINNPSLSAKLILSQFSKPILLLLLFPSSPQTSLQATGRKR